MSNKKLIGITGGIGSGKTSAAKIIEELGYPVYNSDNRAKEIINENHHIKSQIINLLGQNSFDKNGDYNKQWVAKQIFNDDEKRISLNNIIHPAVKENFNIWANNQKSILIFKESALLFETGIDKECYATILVSADEEIRIKRIMERDKKSKNEVINIIKKQLPEDIKQKKANFIIYNNEEKNNLEIQIKEILKKL